MIIRYLCDCHYVFLVLIIDEPQVYVDLWVYHNTLKRWVWCVPLPYKGMVMMGVGPVLSGPTHTVPMPIPSEPAWDPWPYLSKPTPIGAGTGICRYGYRLGKKTPGGPWFSLVLAPFIDAKGDPSMML